MCLNYINFLVLNVFNYEDKNIYFIWIKEKIYVNLSVNIS